MAHIIIQVSKHAGDKLIESIILDYLLSTVARQGHVWTESDHADMAMDGKYRNSID